MFEFYTEEHVNKLQMFIEENFALDGTSKHLIRNILEYVSVQEDDEDTILDMLEALLNGIAIDREEIINAVMS